MVAPFRVSFYQPGGRPGPEMEARPDAAPESLEKRRWDALNHGNPSTLGRIHRAVNSVLNNPQLMHRNAHTFDAAAPGQQYQAFNTPEAPGQIDAAVRNARLTGRVHYVLDQQHNMLHITLNALPAAHGAAQGSQQIHLLIRLTGLNPTHDNQLEQSIYDDSIAAITGIQRIFAPMPGGDAQDPLMAGGDFPEEQHRLPRSRSLDSFHRLDSGDVGPRRRGRRLSLDADSQVVVDVDRLRETEEQRRILERKNAELRATNAELREGARAYAAELGDLRAFRSDVLRQEGT